VSENEAGNGLAGSSTNDALEAVKELFSGDGQAKKGRKGQNEVCCRLIFLMNACKVILTLILDLVALGLSPPWCASQINDMPHIDESGPSSSLP
jgi:hypothetical protein